MFLVEKEGRLVYQPNLYYLCYMYVIIKMIKHDISQIEIPVIILDSQNEVMEFETEEEAEKLRKLFETNSDSGHKYILKKL